MMIHRLVLLCLAVVFVFWQLEPVLSLWSSSANNQDSNNNNNNNNKTQRRHRKRHTRSKRVEDEEDEKKPSREPKHGCAKGNCVPPPTHHADRTKPCPRFDVKYTSIKDYLNPEILEDEALLDDIKETLHEDHLVVIRDAFIPEFAEAMQCDLDRLTAWKLQTGYQPDGFHYSHHNIYDKEDFSEMMNSTLAVFEHPDTKKWISELSGRDCMGTTEGSSGSASYYMPGDHSLPHTDHMHQRTVAYVWHLSKDWQPEWGGALYWNPENSDKSFVHASFNTLSLFSVNTASSHFVTTVSPHAKEKRLSFNGWYHSDWIPTLQDPIETMLKTKDQMWELTYDQFTAIGDILELGHDVDGNRLTDESRRKKLEELMVDLEDELWPDVSNTINEL